MFVDDFDFIDQFANHYNAARYHFIDIVLKAIVTQTRESARRLIVVGGNRTLHRHGHEIDIPALTRDDQEFLFRAQLLPEQASRLNFDDIYSFAPKLTCREIGLTCDVLHRRSEFTTDQLIEYVARFNLESNVNLGQIEEVTFADIKGIDEVIEALRIQLLLPLQHTQLTRDLELRPKRGVLLYGPPGTGKTSIGRALAHELGSKFFLIDGEASDRECDFGQYVYQVFAAAEKNAPSIVFIDDSDVLFKHGDDDDSRTLYRHLLSQLDGIHSKGKGDVCVMLTAMDVSELPPALVRSGRIELWLEVNPPNLCAREEILRKHCERLLDRFPDLDVARIAEATEDFTGADLRRLVDDAKNQIAYKLARNGAELNSTDEFLSAIKGLSKNIDRHRSVRAGFLS